MSSVSRGMARVSLVTPRASLGAVKDAPAPRPAPRREHFYSRAFPRVPPRRAGAALGADGGSPAPTCAPRSTSGADGETRGGSPREGGGRPVLITDTRGEASEEKCTCRASVIEGRRAL